MTAPVLILKWTEWPASDQAEWRVLFEGSNYFERGALAHLRASSRKKLEQSYGHWLSYLARRGALQASTPPWARVNECSIKSFILEEQARVSSRTVYDRINDLCWIASKMNPDHDWLWLERLVRKLRANTSLWSLKPRKKTTAQQIFKWGLERMQLVRNCDSQLDVSKAVMFRDGLMLAFLIAVPLRVRSLTLLSFAHLSFDGEQFSVHLGPEDVKDGRAHEFCIPREMTGYMQDYLDRYRPILLQEKESEFIWISARGAGLGIDSFTKHLAQLTQREFGETLRPHAFREIAATAIAFDAPHLVGVTADLLGHASLTMSEKHYNRANGVKASNTHQEIIRSLRKKAKHIAPKSAFPKNVFDEEI